MNDGGSLLVLLSAWLGDLLLLVLLLILVIALSSFVVVGVFRGDCNSLDDAGYISSVSLRTGEWGDSGSATTSDTIVDMDPVRSRYSSLLLDFNVGDNVGDDDDMLKLSLLEPTITSLLSLLSVLLL
jgi:hypothetical protein